MLPDKLLSQFERAKDNQNYNFLYLTEKEILVVFDYHRQKYLKEKKRIIVKVYDLDNNRWLNLDPVSGITNEGGNDGVSDHEDLTGLQGGTAGEHYHFTNSQHGKILLGNYIADWDASTNTPTIPPSSAANKDQFYRVVVEGSTTIDGVSEWEVGDLIYSLGSVWIKIPLFLSSPPAKNTTIIELTGNVIMGTPISLVSSGAGYTKTKDNGNLGTTSLYFEDKEAIAVYRNGVYQRKGFNVNYVTSTSISFPFDLKPGEILVIIS